MADIVQDGAGWRLATAPDGVMIATPCYDGNVRVNYFGSAMKTYELLMRQLRRPDGAEIPLSWVLHENESLVSRARNVIAAKFMAHEPRLSLLIFIDGDLQYKPEDVLRLIGHDEDVVLGVYPKKMEPTDFVFTPLLDENGMATRNPVTGAIELVFGGTGFMCIKRGVFETMAEAYPHLKLQSHLERATPAERRWYYNFFNVMADTSDEFREEGPEGGALYLSEDYGFCRLWRDIGGHVWCDPEIELGHDGRKMYRGKLADLFGAPDARARPGWEHINGWLVPKDDPWFKRLHAGPLDRDIIAAALDATHDFRCAVDVGAHIGTWTRPLAARFKRVVAIEPNPAMAVLLRANVAEQMNVEVIETAAWHETTRLEMTPGRNSGETMVQPVTPDAETTCFAQPIDLMALDDVDLMKVDVEKTELEALHGAELTLRRCKPVVVIEEHPGHEAAREWLQGLGMREKLRMPILPHHTAANIVMVWP